MGLAAVGGRPRRSDSFFWVAQGFTLFEVLLAVAVVAMVGGLAIYATDRMVVSLSRPNFEQTLQQALHEARQVARSHKEPVLFGFDSEQNAFRLLSGPDRTWVIADRDVTVRWHAIPADERVRFDPRASGVEIPSLMIAADGYTTWMRVSWRVGTARAERLLDPFTFDLVSLPQ